MQAVIGYHNTGGDVVFSHVTLSVCSRKCSLHRDVRFGPKVGQIGTKWEKTGTSEDHFQNILSQICPIFGQG